MPKMLIMLTLLKVLVLHLALSTTSERQISKDSNLASYADLAKSAGIVLSMINCLKKKYC